MKDLLVCVAHHHAPDRLQYLLRMLEAFTEYELTCDILLDTNAAGLDVKGDNVTTVHYASLAHPFHLTFMHRRHMKERIEDYRWFMYCEDDIYLSFENFAHYQRNFELLYPAYVPSFIRVEVFNGHEFVLDVTERQELQLIGTKFCTLKQPYHAFWIMPQWALKQSMTPEFTRLSDSREAAASYPMADLQKTPVVEIKDRRVSLLCYAYHIPNNYAPCLGSAHGKIRVEDVFLP